MSSRFPSRSSSKSSPLLPGVSQARASVATVEKFARERGTWLLAVAAIVVVVVVYLIARERFNEVHAWARVPSWIGNPVVMFLIFLASLLLAASATGDSLRSSNALRKLALLTFVAVAALLVITAQLVYRSHRFLAAFWVSLGALVCGLVHLYCISMTAPRAATMCLPLAVVLVSVVYMLWHMADETSDNHAKTTPVYERP